MLEGYDNTIYIQTFLRRWRPFEDFVRFSGTARYDLRLENKAVISRPVTGDTIRTELIHGDDFMTKKTLETTIVTGKPGSGNQSVTVQFLGDSFTQGLYFREAFLESGYVPAVKLVGTRSVTGHPGQKHEGRGGWTLKRYFSHEPENPYSHNPFWQPKGEYRYWGSTAFWKNARYLDRHPETDNSSLSYHCSHYDITPYGDDGRLSDPVRNDLMYDPEAGSYITWQGRAWEPIDGAKLEWHFDYGKYLSMQRIEAPDFLIVMLGLNDFRNAPMPADFSLWNRQLEQLAESYLEAVPHGRLVISTPCTSCGVLDNQKGDFTVRQNAAMWEHRNNVIRQFDNREHERIYVVDASVTLDNEGGYRYENGIQTGNPHPYNDYPRLGIPIAAFVQHYRDL